MCKVVVLDRKWKHETFEGVSDLEACRFDEKKKIAFMNNMFKTSVQ